MTRAALLTSSAFLVIAWIVPCAPWHALTTTRGHRSAVSMMARPKGASKAVRREKLLDNMDSGTSRREPDGKWEEDPSTPLALLAVRAGDARKARDVSALRVGHLTSATNYFVNMVGSSKAQINAIVKSVEDDAEEAGFRVGKRQGTAVSGWVCLDFDDVVVNVFSEEQRDFYKLDLFWHAAEFIDLTGILIPNLAPSGSERSGEGQDVDEWLLGGEDDWELDDDAWALPELSISDVQPSISTPDKPTYADPAEQMAALAERAKAAQLAERASAAAPPKPKPEVEVDVEEVAALAEEMTEALAVDADEDEEGGDVDWEAEAAAVAKELEAEAKVDVETEDEEETEDWALGDDKLRDMVKRLEDDIDDEVDEVTIGGFQE